MSNITITAAVEAEVQRLIAFAPSPDLAAIKVLAYLRGTSFVEPVKPVSVDRNTGAMLYDALRMLKSVITKQGSPVLSHVLVTSRDGILTITATNVYNPTDNAPYTPYMCYTATLPGVNKASDFRVLLPFSDLFKLSALLKKQTIIMTHSRSTTSVVCGEEVVSTFADTFLVADYPLVYDVGDPLFTEPLDVTTLKRSLVYTSTDASHFILQCIQYTPTAVIAADGFRLIKSERALLVPEYHLHRIVATDAVSLQNPTVSIHEKCLTINGTLKSGVSMRLVTSTYANIKYPNILHLIPTRDATTFIRVATKPLLDALRLVRDTALKDNSIVTLGVSGGTLVVSAQHDKTLSSTTLKLCGAEQNVLFGVNVTYLTEIISSMDCDEVAISAIPGKDNSFSTQPIIFVPSDKSAMVNAVAVLMPMHLSKGN